MKGGNLLRHAAQYVNAKASQQGVHLAREQHRPGDLPAVGIVFSCDRPMQLDALIRSHRAMDLSHSPIRVLYKASTPDYQSAYRDLISEHEDHLIEFVDENQFARLDDATRALTETICSRTFFFLVDDIIFTDAVDISAFSLFSSRKVIPSLRLGRNIAWSYTHNRSQRRPTFTTLNMQQNLPSPAPASELIAWKWWLGDIDWRYPGSLDGNIFSAEFLRELLANMQFAGPNGFEAALNSRLMSNRRIWGICFSKSRLVNVPLNRVQTEVSNRHGRLHQDVLLDAWKEGRRIDVLRLAHVENSSVHEELHVPLTRRDV